MARHLLALAIAADPSWGWSTGPAWGLNGFRHPPEAKYPAGFFTAAQLEQLEQDPALTIEDLADEAGELDPAAVEEARLAAEAKGNAAAEKRRAAAAAKAAETEKARVAAEAKANAAAERRRLAAEAKAKAAENGAQEA